MEYQGYELSANADFTFFGFVSRGKNGPVTMAIKYSATLNNAVYNLGYGSIISINDRTGETEIDDMSPTGNSDIATVLATVFRSVVAFTQCHPEAYVLFGSSNPVKLRMYRMALSKNYSMITETFDLFVAVHNAQGQLVNRPYDKHADVRGYFLKRKM
ncbi:hypothetical protein OGH69_07420 [Flavobacterium sp. MFBS3-15]|uniref:DUF6934 family protein n=1 Tax=Flavobacterium sp. MFBS3-15 TaxID=2989816 RepID=UPI002235E6D2|nr:hypothetical protein [Flavobacterium sp. MFBS3-15]MCW4468785.1 hypothetical protein [Flavobacterium sp. MFBS3-15]